MITKKMFVKGCDKMLEYMEHVDELQHEFNIDLTETKSFESVGIMFDLLIYSNFNEEASDLVMWWMFEDAPKEIEVDGKTIDLETLDNLWEYLKSCGYVE